MPAFESSLVEVATRALVLKRRVVSQDGYLSQDVGIGGNGEATWEVRVWYLRDVLKKPQASSRL